MSAAPSTHREVALVPANTLHQSDVDFSMKKLDQWLLRMTNDTVGWNTIHTVGSVLPGVGGVFAAIDAIADLITLIDGNQDDVVTWISFGINVFGIMSFPGVGAARAAIRPTLHMLRSHSKATLGNALLTALESNLNALAPGAIEDFATALQQGLASLLSQIADKIKQTCLSFASMIRSVASPEGQRKIAETVKSGKKFVASTGILGMAISLLIDDPRMSDATVRKLLEVADTAQTIGANAHRKINALADPSNTQSIGYLVSMLLTALANRKGRKAQAQNIAPHGTSQATAVSGQGQLVARSSEAPAKADPSAKKDGCPSTCRSISFARGSETLTHTDFSLPGCFALQWSRTYRSSLAALDRGVFGARWITPFSTCLDVLKQGVLYHAADGRSHAYPLPKIGKHHYDAIEGLVLIRTQETQLVIARGYASQESYQRQGERFVLQSIRQRGGARIDLHYEHHHQGTPVLSDLVTYQNEVQHQHLATALDEHGRISALWQVRNGQPHRQLAAYRYDEHGDLLQADDEHQASWSYQYQDHLITRYSDRSGRGINLQWQGSGPDAKAVREWADDGSFDTRLAWDADVRLTCVTDAHGQVTKHYYDGLGFTYRVIHPDGSEEWLLRDTAKNITQHLHADGSTERFAYDERGNLLQHTRADGSCVHYAYDDHDQLLKTRDAEGGLWRRDYDQRGNLIETIDPLENTTQYRYNSDNLPIAVVDANGNEKTLAYTADGLLSQYTDCSGHTRHWHYDPCGQLIRYTDALGQVTEYAYEAGQLARLTNPDHSHEQFERDAEGRLLSHTDALQRRTCWAYNVAGLIATRTDAQGHTLDYRWDRLGRLLELRNENHSSARFSYDSMGRLLSETGFDGKRRSYHYHAESGVLAQQLDEDRIIEFAFDPLGRLSQRHAGHRHGQHWQSEAFHYDGNGQLLMAENSQSKLQWFYDRAGNLSREHQYYRFLDTPSVAIWQHEYDALNQRCATTRPDGHRVSWLTYGSGHLLAIKLDDAELLSYQRDALHREIGRVQGNGLQQRQQWTANGYLHTQSLTRPGSNDYLRKRQHHYDPAGQLTTIDDSNRGTLSYRYDPLNRLLGAHSRLGTETFAFDPASNLLDPSEAPQANGLKRSRQMDNLLHQYLGNHYRYDPRGNLSERWLDGQHGRFTWDLYDRLVGYEDARLKVNYGYDALGRRLYKQSAAKYQDRAQAGPLWNRKQRLDLDERYGCKSSIYGWDGDHLAFESTYHPRGERTTHYLYEPGTFVPLVQASYEQQIALLPEPSYDGPYDIDQDPVWQHQPQAPAFKALDWYQCDHLGTPLELTDQHGEMVWRADYQAWGQAQVRLSEAAQRRKLDTALRFQGQYLDVETGLHYNRYRYYDPQVGRFVSADPIGYAGGLNLYQYAPNPIAWTDPLGLESKKPVLGSENNPFATSRAARVESMRQAKIPKSQQPISQFRNESGWEYRYEMPQPGGGKALASVQQQTMDISHPDKPHWEAGKVKLDDQGKPRMNRHGRPQIRNNKSKAFYEQDCCK